MIDHVRLSFSTGHVLLIILTHIIRHMHMNIIIIKYNNNIIISLSYRILYVYIRIIIYIITILCYAFPINHKYRIINGRDLKSS